jgi:site-specific DNA recombinase
MLFDLYAKQRLGARMVATWLNDRGHRTRSGKPWSYRSVYTVLRNRVYLGEIFFRNEHHAAPHPPLVDSEVFDAAQALLKERGEDQSKRASSPSEYLLSGVVTCARCEHHYVGGAARGRNARYRYYTCFTRHRYGTSECDSDRLSAPALEAAVIDAMNRTYLRADLVEQAVAASQTEDREARPKTEAQLHQVEGEVKKVEQAIDRYLLAFEAGTLVAAQCGERLAATFRVPLLAPVRIVHGVVEAPGIEPGSEAVSSATSTSVVPVFISPVRRPGTGLRVGQSRCTSPPPP